MTDLEWLPATDTVPVVETPRKCRHPRDRRTQWTDGLGHKGWTCACGHVADPLRVRMGRNARYNGKRKERVEMRRAGLHTGNANKADDGQSVDGMFTYQSKARATAAFPGWQATELDKLRIADQGKVPVLVVIELPGRGRKPRKLAVLEWQDWLDLHGDPTKGAAG